MSRRTAIITISASVAGAALAERPALQAIGPAGRIDPIAVGKVAIVDGQLQVVSPMYPYRPSSTRSGWTFLWDSCEFDDPNPNLGAAVGFMWHECYVSCFEGIGFRWYFGEDAHNPFVCGDMSDIGVPSPVPPPVPYKAPTQPYLANGLYFSWYWSVDGVGTSEQCTVIILPSDTYADCTSSAPDDGFVSGTLTGVILDFGVLQSGDDDFGYYYAGVDLSETPITMDLTTATGYSILLSQTPGAAGPPFICASRAQCMIWGTGEDEPMRDCRTGTQNEWQYDVVAFAPVDCVRDSVNECVSYWYGVCPPIELGPALGFVTNIINAPCACAGDFDGDRAVTIGDLSAILSTFGGPASNTCMDFDDDGVISISDLAVFLPHFADSC